MVLKLLDYKGTPVEHDIGELENIAVIKITVITGDEIATVIYKDYTTATFDSSDARIQNYFDDEYEIYHIDETENIIDDPEFINRRGSYWR